MRDFSVPSLPAYEAFAFMQPLYNSTHEQVFLYTACAILPAERLGSFQSSVAGFFPWLTNTLKLSAFIAGDAFRC